MSSLPDRVGALLSDSRSSFGAMLTPIDVQSTPEPTVFVVVFLTELFDSSSILSPESFLMRLFNWWLAKIEFSFRTRPESTLLPVDVFGLLVCLLSSLTRFFLSILMLRRVMPTGSTSYFEFTSLFFALVAGLTAFGSAASFFFSSLSSLSDETIRVRTESFVWV